MRSRMPCPTSWLPRSKLGSASLVAASLPRLLFPDGQKPVDLFREGDWPDETPAPSLGFAILIVLRNKGPEIVDFFLVLDAGESHFGAGNFGFRILDVFLELGLIPGDPGILVGIRIAVT